MKNFTPEDFACFLFLVMIVALLIHSRSLYRKIYFFHSAATENNLEAQYHADVAKRLRESLQKEIDYCASIEQKLSAARMELEDFRRLHK